MVEFTSVEDHIVQIPGADMPVVACTADFIVTNLFCIRSQDLHGGGGDTSVGNFLYDTCCVSNSPILCRHV